MNTQIPQSIFDAVAHGGVLQDKATLPRTYKASGEVSYPAPPAQPRPKHHGSQKRQLREVSGCITNDAFQRLEAMRNVGKKNEVSRSSVVGKFVTQGIQQNADMQYISMLEPIIKNEIKKDIGGYSNRVAFLAANAYYKAAEADFKLDELLRYIIRDSTELQKIQADARNQARTALSQKMGGKK
jgi:hypothetical protein